MKVGLIYFVVSDSSAGYDVCVAYALLLEELANQRIQHSRVGKRRATLNLGLDQNLLEELSSLSSVKLVARRELLADELLKSGNHLNSPPGALPVDLDLLTLSGMELGLV